MSEPSTDIKKRLPGEANASETGGAPPEAERQGGDAGGGGGGGAGGLLVVGAVALLLAVVAFVLMRSMSSPVDEAAKGGEVAKAAAEEEVPDVTLNLYVERGGKAEPLPPGQDVAVGDNVLFELASDAPAPVRLWIEESGVQIQDLGIIQADPKAAMIGAEGGMLAWGFGSARTVTVRASAAKRGCPAVSCASQVVVAR